MRIIQEAVNKLFAQRHWRFGIENRVLNIGLVWGIVFLMAGCSRSGETRPSPTPQQTSFEETTPTVIRVISRGTPIQPVALTPTVTRKPAPTKTSTPIITPTPPPSFKRETVFFSGALSVEDLNTLMLDIWALPGVQDVQGGMQDLVVIYDPEQTSLEKILEIIQSHGYEIYETEE